MQDLFTQHKPLLDKAVEAIQTRGYWSPFAEMPSPKVYGETANDDGKRAFEALLHKPFVLDQPGTVGQTGSEHSPFGIELGVTGSPSKVRDVPRMPSHRRRRPGCLS
jgi:hypothetical protein